MDACGLALLLPSNEQDDDVVTYVGELHPVSGTIADAQLRDAFTRARESGVSCGESFDSDEDAGAPAHLSQQLSLPRLTLNSRFGSVIDFPNMEKLMTEELNGIRALFFELPPRGGGRRCPKELRDLVVDYARTRRVQRATVHVISSELGVSENTIARWCSAMARPKPPTFVPVQLQSSPQRLTLSSEQRLTLESDCGWRVTELSVADVAELLRAKS